MRCALLLLAAACILLPATLAAQPMDGYIDFNQSVEQQIIRLEGLVGGDNAAFKQVVVLQWLAQLYGILGRLDDVERCYVRILRFYPDDIPTLNSYGEFLMDTRGDLDRAEKLLRDAHLWGRARDERSLHSGTTYRLWAQLSLERGEVDKAIELAEMAMEIAGETASPQLLRTLGRAYRAGERYDEAADVYFRLIANSGASNRDDINELQTFISQTSQYDQGSINERVAEAVADADRRRREDIEAGGGTVVEMTTPDGVRLEGTLRKAEGKGAVLYVHDFAADRAKFTPYGQLLFIDDITSLTVDLRGHGASRADTLVSPVLIGPDHFSALPEDVLVAYRYLRDKLGFGEDHIAVVSAGRGCAIVEKAIHRGGIRPSVLYLSPAFLSDDRELVNAASFHPSRPTAILFSSEDLNAMRSLTLFEQAKEHPALVTRMYERAGHGLDLLRREPAALEYLQTWLRRETAQ